jgi:thiol:disulfide interchange protein DsbD
MILAFVGGLILNLMPCVLPVLAIKLFGISQLAHKSRSTLLLHGWAYVLGTVVSMLGLATVVIVLKATGTRVGWGFQFQEPLFLAAISGVLLVFSLNLFGVFEIYSQGGRLARLGMNATGPGRSFLDGLLAVVVATPCSAPFLGTAVGFALASPAAIIVAVFAAIGVGLAFPFVAVTLIPGWAHLLPRPGPWMRGLRAVLGLALMGTVLWLVWLMQRLAGLEGLAKLLAFLAGVMAATCLYGLSQRRVRLPRLITAGMVPALLIAAGSLCLQFEPRPAGLDASRSGAVGWEPFDPGHIATVLASGGAVFVDFTADWCITCKVNETLVIQSNAVVQELARRNIVRFKADWTHRNEAIRAELARYGRAGVPMYLVYSPEAPSDPIVLPELLTARVLLDALRRAAPVRPDADSTKESRLAGR